LPAVIGNGCEYFGTDSNEKSIRWCSENLLGIQFNKNTLKAKLPYEDGFIDVIYGISVFTHLSEKQHYQWYSELYRILKPNGIMFLTTQGDNFKVKLTALERKEYEENKLIVRGNTKEGHRTFSAFHPPEFMAGLFSNAEILEHIKIKPGEGKWLPQDIWIIRKN
jgi:cyclopropane fatty-acyl-phospholipid synthase-like methyltransferase